ncbi:competence protein ComK [Lysinibacillus louembei]|uniref:Competence protein ComK n=1 Tax=Lysinibacillus louembei TaxID=1470088 RepID=A0ABZ0RY25_9BACI|nr:competence protein ComK [Lysinibacillus louembei]WPK12385.1 competence protein ComK [Lysinibacillus louembei]
MNLLENYIFTIETVMLAEGTNEYGEFYSIVVEKQRVLYVAMSKQKLLEYNLNHFGSSYRGARDGSRAILGNVHVYPIAINPAQNIYWFPTESITSPSSVWIALHCLTHYEDAKNGCTRFILTNGRSYFVPVRYKAFRKRVDQALLLKAKMEQRTQHMSSTVLERLSEYETIDLTGALPLY